jgi:hypothetical protein
MKGFAVSLAVLASALQSAAVAHEGHKTECNETALNALAADIQAMEDGEAKSTAAREVETAMGTMAERDVEACLEHMHKAMEAMEE